MLEVKPTHQHGCMATGRNDNEAITGAASQAFSGWLHHWYVPVELPSAGEHIISPHDTLLELIWTVSWQW